jgi:hypothetical protein
MSIDDDEYWYRQDEAMALFAEETLRETSRSATRSYLGEYGDAIEQRVLENISEAETLLTKGHPSAAIVHAATALEISIRFLIVRPLVQGAFLSDEWASILASRIGTGRTEEDRRLLPTLVKQWKFDIASVNISGGKGLWETIVKSVLPWRNQIVHAGERPSYGEATVAIECARALLNDVVHEIALSLGFTLERTGKWCEIHDVREQEGSTSESWMSFDPKPPFNS